MKHIDTLHYITHLLTDYPIAQQVEDVCCGGCRWIQLRMKHADTEERLATAQAIYPLVDRYRAKLIINDDAYVAKAVNAHGVHIGAEDMHPSDARHLLGPDKIIGCTANTLDDVLRLSQYDIDYIGLGPFRFTPTKEKLSPVLGHEGIHRIIAAARTHGIRIPIIAIGGIAIGDIDRLMGTGIYGVAVSKAIHGTMDKVAACRAITAQLTAHNPFPTINYESSITNHRSTKDERHLKNSR
ncbi:thiamine phosphate synthase [Parapedobacter indicus]|uniref:Thiamine-phosphate synthase n=1 Tax=Parapedobacter indicus TaxID=1477437 RepID=A0A1I3Q152_9SPHI|nr:thiamine phosphate synthase [Parapedobacter indicus]PPL00651.1 thiamine-phosphate diphosphorylase [Parapedobacter indicus]SFJ27934.1 thiamine-phosphate diphosphorylase [Parapedobacter indicus]